MGNFLGNQEADRNLTLTWIGNRKWRYL